MNFVKFCWRRSSFVAGSVPGLAADLIAAFVMACLVVLLGMPRLSAQETKEKVTVDDVDRTYMLRLPRGYDAQRHYPVVILLHGLNQDADDMERLTQFD